MSLRSPTRSRSPRRSWVRIVGTPIAKSNLMYCFGAPTHRITRSVRSVEELFEFLISKFWARPCSVFGMVSPISVADPSLSGWEGGISGRDGVSSTASNAARGEPKLRGEIGGSRYQPYCEGYCQGYPEGYQVHNKLGGKAGCNLGGNFRQHRRLGGISYSARVRCPR